MTHLGVTYDEPRDGERLNTQRAAVLKLMLDHHPRTLREVAEAVGAPEASVSARLRDLRKERYGAYRVERQHVKSGLWRYRVLEPLPVRSRSY